MFDFRDSELLPTFPSNPCLSPVIEVGLIENSTPPCSIYTWNHRQQLFNGHRTLIEIDSSEKQ